MKRAFDQKVSPGCFQVGDLVLKRILPPQTDHMGKWTPNYDGPYIVIKVFDGGALMLATMDGENFTSPVNSDANRYTRGISLRSPSNDRGCFSSTVGIWYLIPAELVRALNSSIPSRLSLLYFPKHLFQIIHSPVESTVSDCISPAELTVSDCISPAELIVPDCIFPAKAAAPQSSMPDQ
ncbi:hypothetical protein KIW84_023294 [Lathyrus oleraceus]|uniref:Uncharacterized protein n=1 Tax=Pisum sativum TaxID=3888 RepID=A0A9D4YH26_PEA|nr:hypothetical protein KIW84_023294 [Pisum sativum]